MGTSADHDGKANRYREFMETIDTRLFPDWFVTVAFYRALHLVEKMFAEEKYDSDNHRNRNDNLKRSYADIWMHYLPMYTQSRRARYQARTISAQTVQHVEKKLAEIELLVKGYCEKRHEQSKKGS